MNKTQRFFDTLKDSRVALIGTGVSHTELIELFLRKGIDVTVLDRKTKDQLDPELYSRLHSLGARFILGEGYLDRLSDFDVVYRTPGMYYNNPKLSKAREDGVIITSEMESFFQLCPCKIYAVTGSDGKTTTTTIISEFLKAEGYKVWLGGNIGKALLPRIESISETDVAVVELSSFQLISMRQSPDVAVITNIAPNHLDVHSGMEEYIQAKCNILDHQTAFSRAVLNSDNEETIGLLGHVRGRVSTFSRLHPVTLGAYLDGDRVLCYSDGRRSVKIIPASRIKIPGEHNIENYLAAISAVWGDVSVDSICRVARHFGGVEHRIEFVRELDGVRYYNDSIASNPTRVIAGLRSFNKRIIIIAGGYDKKIPFEPLAGPVNEFVKVLILMGDTASKIEKAVTDTPLYDSSKLKILHAGSMSEAVALARENAEPGDIVSLSPACASFDMYPNFEARGRDYKSIVSAL
ncbi:MAG TPA: UDP-N-acetylmuramoyl-L-alanine--D-glutamate ligase [Candidatus Faeciplasma avium]|uniref:UDP-N-acetylmuramoylalanine--D-glutamate ligase n=1 Tax=Candidatus Faeciplasma avium TaxID=2840798 RepID=A0A9D1NR95_9FIRM|nr:UDP-N-acetylmuramoyl-L-alanine--D-glutamate ligase [Candidatus Faeciplasma avium]